MGNVFHKCFLCIQHKSVMFQIELKVKDLRICLASTWCCRLPLRIKKDSPSLSKLWVLTPNFLHYNWAQSLWTFLRWWYFDLELDCIESGHLCKIQWWRVPSHSMSRYEVWYWVHHIQSSDYFVSVVPFTVIYHSPAWMILYPGSSEEYYRRYGRHKIEQIWRDDIFPCRVYLRHWYAFTPWGIDCFNFTT